MKGKIIRFLLFSIFSSFALAESSSVQIVVPKFPCTGDVCELKYVFSADVDFFSGVNAGDFEGSLELSSQWQGFLETGESCFIQKASLENSGGRWTLTLNFIPWQPGTLVFPPMNIADAVRFSLEKNDGVEPFFVELNPVEINSISEKAGVTNLRPAQGPFFLPGTTFLLIFFSFVFLVAAVLLTVLAVKFSLLADYCRSKKNLRQIKKVSGKTVRSLKKLLKSKNCDRKFCRDEAVVLRNYLSKRFDPLFNSLPAKDLYSGFEKIAGGKLSETQDDGALKFAEIFARTDYIRFASGSVESEFNETKLLDGERQSLVEKGISAVNLFMEV